MEHPLVALLLGQHCMCLGELEDGDVLVLEPAASQLRGCCGSSARGTATVNCVTIPQLGLPLACSVGALKALLGSCK